MPSASDAAIDYLRQRDRLRATLERVNGAIRAWEEWEANRHLPPHLQRDLPTPHVPRTALDALHRVLMETLRRLEQDWPRRS